MLILEIRCLSINFVKNTEFQQQREKEFNPEGLSNRPTDGKNVTGGLSHPTSLSSSRLLDYLPKRIHQDLFSHFVTSLCLTKTPRSSNHLAALTSMPNRDLPNSP